METTQIILIVVIAVLLIAYPIIMVFRNKKENQKMQEQTNSIKRGDRVLTTSGIYGTVVDMQLEDERKVVTLETGTEKNKGYITIDAYAIYRVLKDDEEKEEPKKVEEKQPAQEEKQQEEKQQEKEVETLQEENKEETTKSAEEDKK